MEIENIKSQMRKGFLEICILNLLMDQALYAAELMAKLQEADLIVGEGTIYPLLNRLKKEEYLTYYWQEAQQGPPRKYYIITEKGRPLATLLKTECLNLLKSMAIILQNNEDKNN